MASITSTPTHYFLKGTYLASGQALRVAEAPLTKKVQNRQLALESTWIDLFNFLLRIEGIQANIDVDWANCETVDVVDEWDVAVRKKSVGMPLEQILIELGYDGEIAKIIADNSAAQTPAQAASTQIALNGTSMNAHNLAMQEAAADNK
jgi:hypothetical protein